MLIQNSLFGLFIGCLHKHICHTRLVLCARLAYWYGIGSLENVMKLKLSALILQVLMALLVLSGQALASAQPCGNCKSIVLGNDDYESLLTQLIENKKYAIPDSWGYENASNKTLLSVFSTNNYQFLHVDGGVDFFGEFVGQNDLVPVTIFSKMKIDDDHHQWNPHQDEREDEIRDGLGGWDDDYYVTPIPEPEEWVLMLAGFSLIGFIANRRKRTEKSCTA